MPVSAVRVADTRSAGGRLPSSGSQLVTVAGRGGVPASGVGAVQLTVTALSPQSSGGLSVFAPADGDPLVSVVSFTAGRTTVSSVIARTLSGSQVRIVNHSPGSVDVVVDVTGYFVAGEPTDNGVAGFVRPVRVADTRTGAGVRKGTIAAGQAVTVSANGRGGVPQDAAAAFLVVTVVSPAVSGGLVIQPSGPGQANLSTISFQAGHTTSLLVDAANGSDGAVALLNRSSAGVNVVVDAVGYTRPTAAPVPVGALQPASPVRVLDTRTSGALHPGQTVTLSLAGRASTPDSGASAAVLTVTGVSPSAAGGLTVWAGGAARPAVSTVGLTPGVSAADAALVPVGPHGTVSIRNSSPGTVHVLVDDSGYYTATATPTDPPPTSPPSDPFTIAVLPDTQQWVMPGQTRFADATDYLAAHRSQLNLREVLQTGDLVNWGWLAPAQYTAASDALRTLETAGVPYLLTVGNHDTRAVGWDGVQGSRDYGGAAYANNPECPERLGAAQCNTRLLIRHSEEFNQTFTASREQDVGGQFEAGKVDNEYATFTAGDTKWLVLSLEFSPRAEAVTWAQNVVATHSDYNVIVESHYLLEKDGSIGQNDQGYGASTPQYVYDNLILRYPNIKLAFSGHIDHANAYRTDTGQHGNTVVSMMLADLGENTTNALRLVTINPDTGVVSSRIYASNVDQDYPQYDRSTTLNLVH